MIDINKVYITKEVATLLNLSSAHVIRLTQALLTEGVLTSKDVRQANKGTYLFNDLALEQLRFKIKR
ncbi:MAG: hypothetical protein ACRCX7_14805 [Cetobacterium sp.]|uniref:hypothetical protein n=1 Tax=Cetobacterium sp. TaxID=2071632 RepID=UPI003F344EFF